MSAASQKASAKAVDLAADAEQKLVVARETLILSLVRFKVENGCANGATDFACIRVAWRSGENKGYMLRASIGGDAEIKLGVFHTDSNPHSDFPTNARWDKDCVRVRITQE